MDPQTIQDPSGRYGRYLHQWNRYTIIRGERAAAQSITEQVQNLAKELHTHRNEMITHSKNLRWWPFTTRRQAQAREASRRTMDAIETAHRQIRALGRFIDKLTDQQEQAHQAVMDLRAQWEAEHTARERYETGEEPRGHTERGLFAEFRKQDDQGRQGPEGRRMYEALNRFNRAESARTAEERKWYHEWHELEWEKVPTMDELLALRQAERDQRAKEDDAPF